MRAVIFANGAPNLPPHWADLVAGADLIVAADGGGRHCLRLGVRPHALIGDLDSLTADEVRRLAAQGAQVLRYPVRKDETDLELALLWAAERGATRMDILAGLGGRWDQSLANLILAAHPRLQGRTLTFYDGPQRLFLIRGCTPIHGRPGDLVSLIPLTGPAHGVTTEGLEYPLREGTLPFGVSLGVSNRLTAPQARVCVRRGLVLGVHIPQDGLAVLEKSKR